MRRQAHVGCSVRGGGGAGREAERGNLPQVPQFPLEVLHGRGQRPSSARNLLCDHPPAPCPLWASSPCKMKRGGAWRSHRLAHPAIRWGGEWPWGWQPPPQRPHWLPPAHASAPAGATLGFCLSLVPGSPQLLPSVRSKKQKCPLPNHLRSQALLGSFTPFLPRPPTPQWEGSGAERYPGEVWGGGPTYPVIFGGLRFWYSRSSTVHTAPLTFSTRTKHLCRLRLCRTAFWGRSDKKQTLRGGPSSTRGSTDRRVLKSHLPQQQARGGLGRRRCRWSRGKTPLGP